MKKYAAILIATALAGCTPKPLTPPGPTTLRVNQAPSATLRAAARALAAEGFEVTTSDNATGIVVAHLTKSPEAHGTSLACRFDGGSAAAKGGKATYYESVLVKANGAGSDVMLSPRVVVNYGQLPKLMGAEIRESDTDCVSSGEVEKRVAAALGAP